MTSELNTRPPARPAPPSGRKPARLVPPSAREAASPPPTASNQAPAVPISVYRELATELQMTHAQVDSLSLQNRHLTEQNLQLRQEITRIVQSALQLQHIVDSFEPGHFAVSDTFEAEPPPPPPPSPKAVDHPPPSPMMPEMTGMASPSPRLVDPRFTEQPDPSRQVRMRPERSRDLGGFWLAVMIFIIIVTAFSAGFFIMRPFLTSDQ